MLQMQCPKCGFVQDAGSECNRCGIIFERYRGQQAAGTRHETPENRHAGGRSLFRRIYRVFRWVSLALSLTVLVLILRNETSPPIIVPPEAVHEATTQVVDFQNSIARGAPGRLRLNQAQLNGWMNSNLAMAKQTTSTDIAAQVIAGNPLPTQKDVEAVRSNVRDVKIELKDNLMRAHVLFDFHGMDMTLELEGRLGVENGYLRLYPTGGKLGSLPLPQGTLESAVQRIFESPENREKFRVPSSIQDIRVESSELVVTAP